MQSVCMLPSSLAEPDSHPFCVRVWLHETSTPASSTSTLATKPFYLRGYGTFTQNECNNAKFYLIFTDKHNTASLYSQPPQVAT